MQNRHLIRIRATQHGVSIVCDPEASLTDLTVALRERLQSHAQFYRNAQIRLNIGSRLLSRDELKTIRSILEDEFALTLSRIVCATETLTRRFEEEWGCPVELTTSVAGDSEATAGASVAGEADDAGEPLSAGADHEPTLVVRQTCRSGMTVSSPGNILIIGNVNPGAEIIAQGDIVVMGVLRGNAHAGASGNTSAVIIALSIEAKQLRVAGHLGLPPQMEETPGRGGSNTSPEMAFIEGSKIIVEPYTGRFPSV